MSPKQATSTTGAPVRPGPKRMRGMAEASPEAKTSTSPGSDMRQSIKRIATAHLITHGFNGTSFRDIALQLDITTTNIHYHFGNKEGLVDEVVKDYVEDALAKHRAIWLDPQRSLAEKLRMLVQYNWQRYQQFNKGRSGGNPWSLIGRLRLESSVLGANAVASLSAFTTAVHELIRTAVDDAWRSGELRDDTPRQDLAFLIINIVNSSSVFTHGAGGFDRLKLFFDAFSRVMLSAYAPEAESTRMAVDNVRPAKKPQRISKTP